MLKNNNKGLRLAITFHPTAGTILLCDFSQGFKEPEMVKNARPVVVLTSSMRGRSNLVTVVSLSTKEPTVILDHHYNLPRASMPMLSRFQNSETWVKGDMIYTVGFHRLDLIKLGTRDRATGKRLYFKQRLGREQMKEIYGCVLSGLNLKHLIEHI